MRCARHRHVRLCISHTDSGKFACASSIASIADTIISEQFISSFSLSQRFGAALVREGQLNLKQNKYADDMRPIDEDCDCSTCKSYTRAYLHHIVRQEAISCSLLSVHNVSYQVNTATNTIEWRLHASRLFN